MKNISDENDRMMGIKLVSIEEKIKQLKIEFEDLDNWEDRYRLIIGKGQKLERLSDTEKNDENLIKGCQSRVWLVTNLMDGKIIFKADSDASITKGIAALLVEVYSEATPAEILQTKTDFLTELNLSEALSMNRANGLASMLKQIYYYATAYQHQIK